MSANRRHNADVPEITLGEFLNRCRANPLMRVQGKVESATRDAGRLVRFNRAVCVYPDSVRVGPHGPHFRVQRIRWDPLRVAWVLMGEWMTLTWRLLDWVTPQLGGNPNGTWVKVTEVGELATAALPASKEAASA